MSMTQIVLGAALGYIMAHAVLFGTRHSMAWLRRDAVQMRLRALSSMSGHTVAAGLVKYGAVIGASAALIALGAWAVGDYYAARSASSAVAASVADSPTPAPSSSLPKAVEEVAAQPPPRQAVATSAGAVDPYADAAFKVEHPAHHAGVAPSLTEKLLRRSEARARSELLAEIQQHAKRSQYDCEAAERAGKYLKAGLDVWGFAAWQEKYFPEANYKGATLPACQEITIVVAPPGLDLRSTVAQGHHP
ncbi:MAG: hypothetical protein WA747_14390 [Steroidobacteraceae bacterium]